MSRSSLEIMFEILRRAMISAFPIRIGLIWLKNSLPGAGRDTLQPMAFADQLGFTFKAPERRIWAVRDLMAAVRTHLEREYTDI